MSNFNCDKCGVAQIDRDRVGYISGCCHYPPDDDRVVLLDFGGGDISQGFFRGAFYRTEESFRQQRPVHPVRWSDLDSDETFIKCGHCKLQTMSTTTLLCDTCGYDVS